MCYVLFSCRRIMMLQTLCAITFELLLLLLLLLLRRYNIFRLFCTHRWVWSLWWLSWPFPITTANSVIITIVIFSCVICCGSCIRRIKCLVCLWWGARGTREQCDIITAIFIMMMMSMINIIYILCARLWVKLLHFLLRSLRTTYLTWCLTVIRSTQCRNNLPAHLLCHSTWDVALNNRDQVGTTSTIEYQMTNTVNKGGDVLQLSRLASFISHILGRFHDNRTVDGSSSRHGNVNGGNNRHQVTHRSSNSNGLGNSLLLRD